MNKIIVLLVIFLQTELLLFSQVKIPDLPVVPEIITDTNRPIYKYTGRVAVQGKGIIDGEIILDTDTLTTHNNATQIKIKDLNKINILLWEKRKRNKSYIFYPAKYELIFRDSRKIIINGNIKSINRLRMRINDKFKYFYLFYYDYFKKSRWVNSGLTDFNSSCSIPAKGCVTSIEVIQ